MNITNDKVTDYIVSFYQPLNSALGILRRQSEADDIPLILKETEMLFRTILTMRPFHRVLEIGTAYGYSSIFFANLMPSCTVTTVELQDTNYQVAKDNVWEQGLEDRIEIIHGDGIDVLDDLIEDASQGRKSEPYDLIFIDAAKSHYREFFDRAEKLCSRDAVIICDNIMMKAFLVDLTLDRKKRHRTSVKRMNEFLEYIYSREDLDVSLLSCGDGLLIIKENRK
jgi:predicted O-methyltransferase YrrM